MNAIRLDEKTAAQFGQRVVIEGTPEYARYMNIPAPVVPDEPKPPLVTHEVTEKGWTVQTGGEPYESGTGEDALMDALKRAEAGEPVSEPGAKFDGISVPKLRVLAAKHGISYVGLKRADLVQALLDGGA